ncbi:MAG: SDR family oxidoreductase [Chloroflexota bacterium]|nr:SDR family oxidoreductase [Chloroflexota bacterium]
MNPDCERHQSIAERETFWRMVLMNTGLKDKVVLITGANHGIGAATAYALATEGCAIFITYLRLASGYGQQAKSADDVVAAIRQQGGRAEAWEADLADPTVILTLFDQAESELGPVNILINNAAYCVPDTFIPASQLHAESRAVDGFPMFTLTAERHDYHFAVNSRASALLLAEYARRHVARNAQWGRIINVSTDGASGFSSEISYGASKHAMESYSRAAASELGRYGITVNVVALAAVQTGWITPDLEQVASANPLQRFGEPEDVADVIVFFASEQSRWVTGQLLYVGGGHVMPL